MSASMTALWTNEAKSYIDASNFSRNPLESAIMSVLSDAQEEVGMGLKDRANFHINIAKVLTTNAALKKYAEDVKAATEAKFGKLPEDGRW